jgi:hypothetical protein
VRKDDTAIAESLVASAFTPEASAASSFSRIAASA